MEPIRTSRLLIRELTPRDSEFIFELLNQPSWLEFIGDKGIRTLSDAVNYIRNGPMEMYCSLGFGLFAVELADSGTPIGISGLIKRETLEDVDLGFAFLERFWGQGYAVESAQAIMNFARERGFSRLLAITSLTNEASGRLLEKIDFHFEGILRLEGNDEDLRLYVWEIAGPPVSINV